LSVNYAVLYDYCVPERFEPTGYVQRSFTFEEEVGDSAELAHLRQLHESLTPYLDVSRLRELVAERSDIYAALRSDRPPAEVLALMDTLAALLRPSPAEQIRDPSDAVALLMITMGHLDQEELRTVLLDTKNRVQDVVTVYRGSLNTSLIRVGEVYKAALRRNSAAIIVAHNHPSADVTPSPEDVLVTRQIVEAGAILDIDCLDHLIIGRGTWLSMRERGLGFT
jgi:DNA repair protein RadC